MFHPERVRARIFGIDCASNIVAIAEDEADLIAAAPGNDGVEQHPVLRLLIMEVPTTEVGAQLSPISEGEVTS